MSSSAASNKVRASHMLIKHQGSRRKASGKDSEGRVISNTTRETVVSQLKSLREDIVSGKVKFKDVASRYSDCSSAKRGDDFGLMLAPFLICFHHLCDPKHYNEACNHAGFLEEGWEYFDLMTKVYKLNPEVDHYSCMADLLGRRGKLKEALEFIHNMPVKPDEGIWGALLGACKIHHNIEIGQYAADRLFEIEPQAAAPYAEIANIYASAGRWNGVSAIRTRMKCKQVTKSGACFFTQGVVHRDVKPGNFLFSRKVNKGYLIDFNLAMDLHHKYVTSDKSAMSYDMGFNHVPLAHAKSLPHAKSRTFLTTKAWEAVNQEAGKSSKSLSVLKNLKRKTNQTKEHADLSSRNIIKSQGADGSGITSAKDATSTRIPSAERMREPVPMQGRKELISLAQEAMQGPNHEVTSIPASKRKRIAAPYERLDRKLVYLTPMPLHSSGIAVAGAGLIKRGNAKHKKEGPCVGTKGFRAPEVLLRSPYQGPKIDIWSAGVTLLYLITGRSPFVGDPDQNVKDIAKLRGSEDLWEVAKLHNRESSFPAELYDMQSLPSKKLRDWCGLNTRRPDFLQVVPRSFFDLVDKCLTVNPRLRISAEEAIRHEFFAPCHEQLRKQRMLRQGLSLDSGTSLLLNTQPDM